MTDTIRELPDELGFKCNDEISAYMDIWFKQLIDNYQNREENLLFVWGVSKAELMDNVYTIIKKHQKANK